MTTDLGLDDEDETPEVDAADSEGADSSDDAATPAAPPAAMAPQLSDYMSKLQAARSQVSNNNLVTGLAAAATQLGHGISRAPGQADLSGINAIAKNNTAPLDLLASQKAAEGQDPDSPLAKQLRALYKPIFDKSGLDSSALDRLGADQIKAYAQGPLEFIDKMKTSESNKALATEAQKQRYALMAQAQQEKLGEKKTKDQNDAYTKLRKDLETFRGNPAAQQAAVAVQNGDKALALVNSAPTMQNLSLLADEMGKVATGGVPGEHGTQALMPQNAQTQVAKLREWITGNPTASAPDVAEYLKNNKEYLNQVIGISKKTLKDYRNNIAKGYKAKVSPESYDEASQDYGLGAEPVTQTQAGGQATVLMTDPKGKLRRIPVDQKDAALAAGGTLIQ